MNRAGTRIRRGYGLRMTRLLLVAALVACEDPTECGVPEPVDRPVPGPCVVDVTEPDRDRACSVQVRWFYEYEGDRVVRAEKHNTVGVAHQLTFTYDYDERGRLAVRERYSAGGLQELQERAFYTYDDADRLIAIESEDQYGGDLERYEYDDGGRLVRHTRDVLRDGALEEDERYIRDDAGVLVARECDGCGRLLEDVDGDIDLICKREHQGDSFVESCDGGHWPLDGDPDSVERVIFDAHRNIVSRAIDGETWVFAERRANNFFEEERHYYYDCWGD